MAITRKTIIKILIGMGLLVFLFLALIIFSVLYESKKDVSKQLPYSMFLNKPQALKEASTIRWNKTNLRFKHYSLVVGEASHFNSEDVKSVKIYQPGDKITFYKAKMYYSIHVDKTYYLIGRDTLDSGEIIEFEYYYSSSDTSVLWQ
ncbi:hypothetical protein [uncultured Lacinutrix sp.]|uniref:hypothetical protein n=1 Tax=uncultured Lacinutrix sp. TaxID=574032 RepID=UPI0026094AC7|nr:hypothetical protein [uncultured Lacinutrix sp.]